MTTEEVPPQGGAADEQHRPLARKLELLLSQVHPPGDNRRYSYRQLSAEIGRRGVEVSPQYLNDLVRGKRSSPSADVLFALADFFGVDPRYLMEENPEVTRQQEEQIRLLAALRDGKVRNLATRAIGVSETNLDLLLAMVEQMRKSDGLGATAPEKS